MFWYVYYMKKVKNVVFVFTMMNSRQGILLKKLMEK